MSENNENKVCHRSRNQLNLNGFAVPEKYFNIVLRKPTPKRNSRLKRQLQTNPSKITYNTFLPFNYFAGFART